MTPVPIVGVVGMRFFYSDSKAFNLKWNTSFEYEITNNQFFNSKRRWWRYAFFYLDSKAFNLKWNTSFEYEITNNQFFNSKRRWWRYAFFYSDSKTIYKKNSTLKTIRLMKPQFGESDGQLTYIHTYIDSKIDLWVL